MRKFHFFWVPAVLAASSMLAACAHSGADARTDSSLKQGDSVRIEKEILRLCGDTLLHESHFGFDSAALSESATQQLDAVARCFISGPLKGKRIAVVGHADPRGGAEHNVELGQRRAQAVADYLVTKEVPPRLLQVSSKGAEDASPEPSDWPNERIVDLRRAD